MVIDALLAPLLAAVASVVDLLPAGAPLPLPSAAPVWSLVQQVDSLIPIMGPLTVMLGVLSFVLVFVGVRLVLTVWNLIYP